MSNRVRLVKNGAVHNSNGDVIRDAAQPHFHNGHRKKAGRTKGVPNRRSGELQDWILGAAANTGFIEFKREMYRDENNKKRWRMVPVATGNGGAQGYLEYIALHDPELFMPMLKAVLPHVIKGSLTTTVRNEYHTMEEVEARMRELGLPFKNVKLVG